MNTEQPTSQQSIKKEIVCPECGVPQSEWPKAGTRRDGQLYCCEGCADGTGCVCAEEADAV
jgi:hypothetical protein